MSENEGVIHRIAGLLCFEKCRAVRCKDSEHCCCAYPAPGSSWFEGYLKAAATLISPLAREEALVEALRPFAAVVFNDNGDVTYEYSNVTKEDYFRAYSLLKRRTLASPAPAQSVSGTDARK